MAKFQPIIHAELDPTKPVPEICSVIRAIVSANPQHEEEILVGVVEAIEKRREQLKKGADQIGRNKRSG